MDTNERSSSSKCVTDGQPSTELYSATINLIIYEGQMIWNRYNVMLAANSAVAVLFAALVARDSPLTELQIYGALAASLFGVILSRQWRRLTTAGWKLQEAWVDHAKQFKWEQDPLVAHQSWRAAHHVKEPGDAIEREACTTIHLFMLAYCGAALFSILKLLHAV